jgi:hypothetical protein
MRAVVTALLALQVLAPVQSRPDPFVFFQPSATVSDADRQQLDRGVPIVKVLETEGQELAVLTAVAVGPAVTSERALAWMRRLDELRKNRFVLATGRFSNPPRLADLERLTLEADDLEDIRGCRPGRCGLKLSASEIEQLHGVIAGSGPRWQSAVQQAFRELMLRRVVAYLGGGHGALETFRDHKRPRSPGQAFTALVDHSPFLRQRLPAVIDELAASPARSIRRGEGFVYWAKERLGGKAVISVMHVALVQPGSHASPESVAIAIQVLANHYIDGSISVTAFVRDAEGRRYLAYLNRSDVDILSGFWGGWARSIIEGRLRKDGPLILTEVRDRIATTTPSTDVEGAVPPRH